MAFRGGKKRIAELVAAARAGDTENVTQLLAKGVDINASEPESGDTALLAAIDKGQWATTEYLLTQRRDLTQTSLGLAYRSAPMRQPS